MNANEFPKKNNARMNRIQKVSRFIRLFLQFGIPLLVLGCLAFGALAGAHLIDLPKPAHPPTGSAGTTATPPTMMLPLWGVLTLVVFFFWYRTALKLFGYFEQGILFTAETVRCIQTLGVIYFIRFLVEIFLCLAVPAPENPWLKLDLSDLFTSFLIIFIGWLIDEARKIREEQELTV